MRSRDGIIAALTVATAAFGLGVYTSAHGGDTSRIHGCVDNRTGALRIVGATQNCTASKETALDWNIAGPRGLKASRVLKVRKGQPASLVSAVQESSTAPDRTSAH